MSLIDSLLKRELEQAQQELANVVAFADQVPALVAEVARINRAIAALDAPIPYVLTTNHICNCGHPSAEHGVTHCLMCRCTEYREF